MPQSFSPLLHPLPPSLMPPDSITPDHVIPLVPKKCKGTEGVDSPESPKQRRIDQFFVKKLSK